MKQIPLTQSKFALVDDDVYEWAKDYKWHIEKGKHTFYAVRSFIKDDGIGGRLRLHHCVVGFPLNKNQVDHIDGNGLNNQRDNLRIVSQSDNQQNQIKHRNGKLVGTSWCKDRNKWLAQIIINGKQKNLGRYVTEQEAHEVYKIALNKIKEGK